MDSVAVLGAVLEGGRSGSIIQGTALVFRMGTVGFLIGSSGLPSIPGIHTGRQRGETSLQHPTGIPLQAVSQEAQRLHKDRRDPSPSDTRAKHIGRHKETRDPKTKGIRRRSSSGTQFLSKDIVPRSSTEPRPSRIK